MILVLQGRLTLAQSLPRVVPSQGHYRAVKRDHSEHMGTAVVSICTHGPASKSEHPDGALLPRRAVLSLPHSRGLQVSISIKCVLLLGMVVNATKFSYSGRGKSIVRLRLTWINLARPCLKIEKGWWAGYSSGVLKSISRSTNNSGGGACL